MSGPEEPTDGTEPALATEIQDQAIAWFERHWPMPRTCPICGTARWTIAPGTYEMPGRAESGIPGTAIPVVVVTCNTCAYVRLFNSLTMQITPSLRDSMGTDT